MSIETMIDNYLLSEPNEERPVYECDICGGNIWEGQSYYEIENKKICADCISDAEAEATRY